MRANRLIRWRLLSPGVYQQVKPEHSFEHHAGNDQRRGRALEAQRIADDGGDEAQDDDQVAFHRAINGSNRNARGGG